MRSSNVSHLCSWPTCRRRRSQRSHRGRFSSDSVEAFSEGTLHHLLAWSRLDQVDDLSPRLIHNYVRSWLLRVGCSSVHSRRELSVHQWRELSVHVVNAREVKERQRVARRSALIATLRDDDLTHLDESMYRLRDLAETDAGLARDGPHRREARARFVVRMEGEGDQHQAVEAAGLRMLEDPCNGVGTHAAAPLPCRLRSGWCSRISRSSKSASWSTSHTMSHQRSIPASRFAGVRQWVRRRERTLRDRPM